MTFSVRRAAIDPELRTTFERYGVAAMQAIMGGVGKILA
jgi:hypothetical protein